MSRLLKGLLLSVAEFDRRAPATLQPVASGRQRITIRELFRSAAAAFHSPVTGRTSPVANGGASALHLQSRHVICVHSIGQRKEVTQLNTRITQSSVQPVYRPAFNAALASPAFAADADIVELVRADRTQAAFELLLPRYRERVYRLALSILRDSATAEDAMQDVFFRIWRALPGYNGHAALSTWIYAITRNTSISILRKRRAQISLDEPSGEDGPAFQLAAPEYDDSAVSSVEKLLQHLPVRYRQAVTLFYMEDKSYEQTAAALAVPLGTVKALLHRGRKRLIALAAEAA